ncbi:MAG: hypothetical protein ACR2NL_04085 [Acidimicrobiia bacterium]
MSEHRGPTNRAVLLGTLGAVCGASILLMVALLGQVNGPEDADDGIGDPPHTDLPIATVITEEPPLDDYCGSVVRAISVAEDESDDSYLNELGLVLALAPNEHVEMWELLYRVVDEPFTYDNFNPAADEADRVLPAVENQCPDLPPAVINDDGRLTAVRRR